jgi:hypothetical protein
MGRGQAPQSRDRERLVVLPDNRLLTRAAL